MASKLWLCLYLPNLAVDSWLRPAPEAVPSAQPPASTPASQRQLDAGASPVVLALVDKQQLVAVSGAARALGLLPGMKVGSAQVLAPGVLLRPYAPEQGQQLLAELAQWAYQFTPAVTPEPPDRLLLEIAGCLRLFHGLDALLGRLLGELAAWHCEVAPGLAITAEGSRLLARACHRDGVPSLADQLAGCADPARAGAWLQAQLHPQPLTYLNLPEASHRRLAKAGFRTIGQLLQVPPASLGKRFGKALVQQLQALTGAREACLAPMVLAPGFHRQRHYLYGIAELAPLRPAINQLLAELAQFFRAHQLVSQRLVWQFRHQDHSRTELAIRVQSAHADVAEFYRLTELRLEQLNLTSPIEAVGLRAEGLAAAEPESQALFRQLRSGGQDLARLLDRLSQRLGPDQLYSLRLRDEHLPELQQQRIAASAAADTGCTGWHHDTPWLPAWLQVPPLPLVHRNDQLWVQGEPVALVTGASRRDSHWWQAPAREKRDYYVARASSGLLYRVFYCHRHGRWFLQGRY